MDSKWYHVCWPRLITKRVEPVVSISWASCCLIGCLSHRASNELACRTWSSSTLLGCSLSCSNQHYFIACILRHWHVVLNVVNGFWKTMWLCSSQLTNIQRMQPPAWIKPRDSFVMYMKCLESSIMWTFILYYRGISCISQKSHVVWSSWRLHSLNTLVSCLFLAVALQATRLSSY